MGERAHHSAAASSSSLEVSPVCPGTPLDRFRSAEGGLERGHSIGVWDPDFCQINFKVNASPGPFRKQVHGGFPTDEISPCC